MLNVRLQLIDLPLPISIIIGFKTCILEIPTNRIGAKAKSSQLHFAPDVPRRASKYLDYLQTRIGAKEKSSLVQDDRDDPAHVLTVSC